MREKPTTPILTIDEHDDFLCSCGNTAIGGGFYPMVLSKDGKTATEVEPLIDGPWDEHTYGCADCEATFYVTLKNDEDNSVVIPGVYRKCEWF